MKNTRKVLLACLFAILAMGTVFAGGGKEKSGKVVLNIMGHGDSAEAEGIGFVRIVEAFEEEYPDIDIVYEVLFDEGYHQKATARIASGDIPDIVYMGTDVRWGGRWAEAGQQVDMTPYLDKDLFDLALFGSPDNADGAYFFVPLGIANITTVVFVNVDLIESLGLEVPTTYEEMVAMVPVADAAGIEVIGTHGNAGWVWSSCIMSSIIAQTTGEANWAEQLVKGETDFTAPEFVAALEFLQTMVADGVMSADAVLTDVGIMKNKFNAGEYLMAISGQWDAGGFSPELQETMQLMAIPALPGAKGQTNTVAATKSVGYGITKAAVDRGVADAAMLWIEYYNSQEEVALRLNDGAIGGAVLANFEVPADMPNVVYLKAELAASVDGFTGVIDAFLGGATNDALNVGMQQVVSGSKTPQQLATELQAMWEIQQAK